MTIVYIAREDRAARWCAVRTAHPGGRIWLACGDSLSYGPVLIGTADPGELACAACRAATAGPDSEAHEPTVASSPARDADPSAFDYLGDPREDFALTTRAPRGRACADHPPTKGHQQ